MVKKLIIDALFYSAVKVSKEPNLILNGDIQTFNEEGDLTLESFFIITRTEKDDISVSSNTKREIMLNHEKIKELNEITRVFVIMWGGFSYFKNSSVFDIFLNTEMYTDIETIQYMCRRGLFDLDSEKLFVDDMRSVLMKKGTTSYSLKRLRNIIGTLVDELKSVKN